MTVHNDRVLDGEEKQLIVVFVEGSQVTGITTQNPIELP